ncbi:hypothetical protein Ga0080574_TMP282 (plasmid) [Salipiger abyssi]|uniref:Uncharacterized protein n=1 Tax=Salipiger abyssi TaxID=1250539 RepID=A0A1P8UMI8_9RHOB|nr:hypothetical protein Ga0080574_TMP282 [Salipiger abyssi]
MRRVVHLGHEIVIRHRHGSGTQSHPRRQKRQPFHFLLPWVSAVPAGGARQAAAFVLWSRRLFSSRRIPDVLVSVKSLPPC